MLSPRFPFSGPELGKKIALSEFIKIAAVGTIFQTDFAWRVGFDFEKSFRNRRNYLCLIVSLEH
jgi:hypothetical protein